MGNLQSSGAITPGDSASSTGILTETGAYTQNSNGTLNIAVGGTTAGVQYDSLDATTAKLAGSLDIQLVNGFVPVIGSTYKVVNFKSETGQFSMVKGLAINSSEHFAVSYQGTDVLLTVVTGAAPTTILPPSIGPVVSTLLVEHIGHGILAVGSYNTASSSMLASRGDFSTLSVARHGVTANSRPGTPARAKLPGKSVNANFEFPLIKLLSVPHMTVSTN